LAGCIAGTFGAVGLVALVSWMLLWSRIKRGNREEAKRMLVIEFVDIILDWSTYLLAFYAGDLSFANDPKNILRGLILGLCTFSLVTWLVELWLYFNRPAKFDMMSRKFVFFNMMIEDGSQVALYAIVSAGNAAGDTGNATTIILCAVAGLQSVLFFVIKLYELLKDNPGSGSGTDFDNVAEMGRSSPPPPPPSTTSAAYY
jgi:hypothetical protein